MTVGLKYLSYRQRRRRRNRKLFLVVFIALLILCNFAFSSKEDVPLSEDIFVFPVEDKANFEPSWELLSDTVTGTIYHAVPSQCDDDVEYTASMFKLDLKNPGKHRIIAIERTMMDRYGLQYGDTVLVVGAGPHNGLWQVQDLMNKRFAGKDRIDFLVNAKEYKTGKWNNIAIFKRETT